MEKLVDLWNNTLWFKILSIIIAATLSYWFGTLAIIVSMILVIYAIITIIRKYILKKPTRFKALYIFILAITLTIVGGYGYAQTHPEEMAQTKLEQQKAKEGAEREKADKAKKDREEKKAEEDKKQAIEKAVKDKAKAEQEAKDKKAKAEKEAKEKNQARIQDEKNKIKESSTSENTTEDNHQSTNSNNAFVDYLNNDLSKSDSNPVDNKTLLNSKTMKFEAKNARTVFLVIPQDIKKLTKDNKQKLANNAQYIYQENYKSWSTKNNINEKNPPMLMIKYIDSQVGDEMAVWIPGTTNIELR
ncbi:energy-coupling factor transporter transmembrane protein EcfT [Lactococcus formosensis]|uniref:hypothetical protein n=1 Tax=Lactococcus formosensis TaxID=1281486 RepID=UPI0024354293|nr:hypothetical protein [Lactococcus formosensis]MDG6176406.1 energy-coupling factor transporter transmembrane protein EcfT [Lactococcus formosensis]